MFIFKKKKKTDQVKRSTLINLLEINVGVTALQSKEKKIEGSANRKNFIFLHINGDAVTDSKVPIY